MVKTTVYMLPEIALRVRQLAAAEGRSQAEIIREAVRAYTGKSARPRPKGVGRYHSGRSDVSQRAEELLRRATQTGDGGSCRLGRSLRTL